MTALPGSLDHLYYNGILDHIPYEAYEMAPVGNYAQYPQYQMANMTATQYLNNARQGALYDNTYVSSDKFVRANQEYLKSQENKKSFRESILEAANDTKNVVSNTPTVIKGIAGAGIILLTLLSILKTKKKPVLTSASKPSFFEKIKNWFRK